MIPFLTRTSLRAPHQHAIRLVSSSAEPAEQPLENRSASWNDSDRASFPAPLQMAAPHAQGCAAPGPTRFLEARRADPDPAVSDDSLSGLRCSQFRPATSATSLTRSRNSSPWPLT